MAVAKKGKAAKKKAVEGENRLDDLEILDDLKSIIYDAIKNDKSIPKVGELLKIIEMKNKMSVAGQGEKKFWVLVNQIRKGELSKPKRPARKNATPKKKAENNDKIK